MSRHKQLSIYIPMSLYERLTEMREKYEINISGICQQALWEYLTRLNSEQPKDPLVVFN